MTLEEMPKQKIKLSQIIGTGWQGIKNLWPNLRRWFVQNRMGQLSWQLLFVMAAKNLRVSRSRSIVTITAIGIGIGSMVFLLSFAYGLQNIVTQRIVKPNSFRMADVASDSTALSLSPETLDQIKNVEGVADVAPVVSIAGSLSLGESKTDVVVVSVENKYFDYANIEPTKGQFFSGEAEQRVGYGNRDLEELAAQIEAERAQVLGVSTDEYGWGQEIDGLKRAFRVMDGAYVPVRATPRAESEIIGYVRGSIIELLNGTEVWGGTYQSLDTAGKYEQDVTGRWWGKWLLGTVPLYQEIAPTVYVPLTDDSGNQIAKEGYIPELSMTILSREEAKLDQEVAAIIAQNQGQVLGEATLSAEQIVVVTDSSASAELSTLVAKEQEQAETPSIAIVEVAKEGGKEVVVSTGLLKTWNLEPDKVLGQKVTMQYIVSGGVIPGMVGRVLSQPVEYTVVGVVSEDKQSLVYVPIAEVESMGVKKYTFAKVLADSDKQLAAVREKVEGLGFSTRSVVDTLLQVERLFRVMRFLLGAFGLIALIVALFGMFNTMTVTLLERTREIGVMKTLGTTDYDVTRIFMVESGILGILGGSIGIIGGVVLGWGVSSVLYLIRGGVGTSLFRIPLMLVVTLFLLSIVIGVVTGIYPARRARGISALNALRYE